MRSMTRYLLPLAASAALTLGGCVSSDTNETKGGLTHAHHAIDYVELTVRDLEEAKRFYGAAFGWTFQDYGPGYAGIRHPDGVEVGGLLEAKEVTTGGPLVVLFSTDLEASVQAVRAAGGTIAQEPFTFPGGRRFHFRDPSGNVLAAWAEALETEAGN